MTRAIHGRQLLAILLVGATASCAYEDDCGGRLCNGAVLAEEGTTAPPEWGEPLDGPADQDPDPQTGSGPGYLDQDGDGFTPRTGDCDDFDPDRHPDALELCDEIDNDCNALVDDGLGYVFVQESDYGAEGIPDYWSYTTYRSSGQMWFVERDTDADGFIDTSEEYFFNYDASGRLILTETDEGMDGSIDENKEYFYDAAGRLERTEEDRGPDGVPDRIDTYIYDSNGIRVAWEMDTDADGLPETVYNYHYHAVTGYLDMLVMDRYDDNMTVTSTTIYAYDYDQSGMMQRVHIDLSGDGVFDNTTEYVYDLMGRMQEALTDIGRDAQYDSVSYYIYDANSGDLTKIEMDTDYDGDLDTRITRWYECSDLEFQP